MNNPLLSTEETERNVLFSKIKKFFTDEPCRLNMDTWHINYSSNPNHPLYPPCKTVGCLAYAAIVCSEQKLEDIYNAGESLAEAAKRILNITEAEQEILFYAESWPEPFRSDYQRSFGDMETLFIFSRAAQGDLEAIAIGKYLKDRMARILCGRIDFFSTTGR